MRNPWLAIPVMLALLCGCPTEGDDDDTAAADGCDGTDPVQLRDCVDADLFEQHIVDVAIERTPGSANWQQVQDLCASRLAEYGFEVSLHEYATGVNVIGTLPGTDLASEIVVVSAHYDHIADCPGADDNGSGVAASMEIARILGTKAPRRTLIVAFWDEEEIGLVGSEAWAAEAADRGDDIVASFVFDTFAYTCDEPDCQTFPSGFDLLFPEQYDQLLDRDMKGDFAGVFGDDRSHDEMAAFGEHAAAVGIEQITLELPSDDLDNILYHSFQRSDHAAFWQAGYPGFFITDTANFRDPYYHCAEGDDTLDTLDLPFAVGVVQATTAAVAQTLDPQP
jgi:Zn-dependent M28 family amino/carboxypeptidase